MRILALMLLATILSSPLEQLCADEPPKAPPSRAVGSIYGKVVSESDIGLTAAIDPAIEFDARDTARWELMGRIMTTFGSPVVERFVKKQKIEATADEIKTFKSNFRKNSERNLRQWEGRLAELKQELAAANLANEEKAKLEKERAMYEKLVASQRGSRAAEAAEELARKFIVAWKTERELHRVFGGRIIFQQVGPEALDARRRLFEQAEKKADIKFDDAGVRHLFYHYANMKHTVVDENALERPWFFDEGD